MATVFLSLGSNLGYRQANLSEALELLSQSLSTQPLSTQPLGTQPLGTQPLGTQPLGTQPLGTQPLGALLQSRVYETEPWHAPSHPRYFNLCVRFETDLQPEELLKFCKKIEHKFGRDLSKKLAPRPLDIDIIFYDNLVYESDNLTIPHPRLHLRRFVLQPLADIAPDFIHPVLKKTITELLRLL